MSIRDDVAEISALMVCGQLTSETDAAGWPERYHERVANADDIEQLIERRERSLVAALCRAVGAKGADNTPLGHSLMREQRRALIRAWKIWRDGK